MGTRSLTVFMNQDGNEIAVMYRQMDGYLEGHGKELADFLADKRVVNGISNRDDRSKIFNGMPCLAAQVVAYFKDGPGSIYLYPAGTRDMWEEYIYIITGETGYEPRIQVESFNGYASAYQEWLDNLAAEVED